MSRHDTKLNPCAIIVSYEPDTAVLLSLLEQISAQTDFLLIDNASTNGDEFLDIAQNKARCLGVHKLPRNIGLASAMNLGLVEVRKAEYAYAVLFDQDSQLTPSFFDNMQMAYLEAQRLSPKPVAAVGPRVVSLRNDAPMPFKLFSRLFKRSDVSFHGNARLYQAEFLISSGCFFVLEHLEKIGAMKEEYFIDNIDLEWCFRAQAKGFEIVGTDYALLHHSIGEQDENLLVRKGVIVSHSPLRSYYSTRNRFALYRESHAPMAWKIRDFPRFILKSLWLVMFSKQRAQYAENIWRGIKDSRGLA